MRLIDADLLMPNAKYKGRYDVVTAYDIANAPTVELEPRKKGKWIIDGHHIKCNRCENIMCSRDREGDLIPKNFCPNCGADMREGEESE